MTQSLLKRPELSTRIPAQVGDDLSDRECQVLQLVAQGLTNHEIADRLGVSINTVKTYIRYAYRKIGVERRSQAAAWTLSAQPWENRATPLSHRG